MDMNQYLEIHCKEVSPHDFYRDVFPEGELEEKRKYVKRTLNQYILLLTNIT